MRRRHSRSGLLVVVVGLVLAGSPALAQEFTFRFGGSDPSRGLLDRTTLKFVELSEQKSKGRIKWEYFCCDQLGDDLAQIEQMMANSVQGYGDTLDWWANWIPEFAIFGWGFVFRDGEHVARFLGSPTYRAMVEKLRERRGVRILAAAPTEPRILFTKNPLTGLEGVRGLKLCVPESRAYLGVWEALQARPLRVTWSEVYAALKLGVVDGCDGPASVGYGARMHEAAPHLTVTNHILSSVHITMNEQAYQGLPPDLRKAVEDAAREAVALARSEGEKVAAETLQRMESEGAKLGQIDVGPFRAALREAVEKAEAEGRWSRGLWATVQDTH
jgi:TRAP-type C4-dicarboxylate transport system substrate-binding protein